MQTIGEGCAVDQEPSAGDGELAQFACSHFLILGNTGSGKSSLSQRLCELAPGLEYVSLGDITRSMSEDDPLLEEVNRLYDTVNAPVGPPELFLDIVKPALEDVISRSKGFILDGMPKKTEEIDPLLKMFRELGIGIDAVIFCEMNPLRSLGRVATRDQERGPKDTLLTALNRTLRFEEDKRVFYSRLGGYLGDRIITVDTDGNDVDTAASFIVTSFIEMSRHRSSQHVLDTQPSAARVENANRLMRSELEINSVRALLAERLVPDGLGKKIVQRLQEQNVPHEESAEYIAGILPEYFPDMRYTPYARARFAAQIFTDTVEALDSISASLLTEAELRRLNGLTDMENIAQIVEEMDQASNIIADAQRANQEHPYFSDAVTGEIIKNRTELKFIEDWLRDNSLMPPGTTIDDLFKLQPQLWRLLTSNQVQTTIDCNYRKHANGVTGTHHSLAPPLVKARRFIANPIGDYRPFIEAVSVNQQAGFYTSFGFLHTVGIDSQGLGYQLEYPVLMIDRELAAHGNHLLHAILNRGRKLYFNHDIWHNLVPVYAEHFRLQHAFAPISYGGDRKEYLDFGRNLRFEKEDYEIGVAMAHARTQQLRLAKDDAYWVEQLTVIDSIVAELPELKKQLEISDGVQFANRTVDYICSVFVGRLLNVLPPGHEHMQHLDNLLKTVELPAQVVTQRQLSELLFSQRVVLATPEHVRSFVLKLQETDTPIEKKQSLTAALIPFISETGKQLDESTINAIHDDPELVKLVLQEVEYKKEVSESGADRLLEALDEIGVMFLTEGQATVSLEGLDRVRWIVMNAPQRRQLKGHIEKVHGKAGVQFGIQEDIDPREWLPHQYQAVVANSAEYDYRRWARQQNEALSMRLYDLLFDDSQAALKEERELLKILTAYESGLGTDMKVYRNGISALDRLLQDLVAAEYADGEALTREISVLAAEAKNSAPSLATCIESILSSYDLLVSQERAYMQKNKKSYIDARSEYEEKLMTLI